ncbi:MAG: GAF domain-containing sensor histidine kinase, partial [Candidatus Dormibacterales bacterium]
VMAALGVVKTRAEPFGEEDVATLQQIANIAALALRNASLFAEAEAAGRTKSDFMNMAAHELRTPLTVLGGYVSMLRDGTFGTPPRRWRDPIEIISAKAAELTDLVDELLMAARLESGAIAPPTGRTDLVAALEDALRRARPRAAMLGASLSSEVPSEEVLVAAEPEHVARIIDNLVNNALTYSRESPWLRVTLTAGPDEAVMSFLDHGRGVPLEMRERIFDQFVRVEDEGPYHPGTGLGLYISRALAERSGGRLRLTEGGPGEGSVFVLWIPRLPV